jgi:hypothetical protein
MQLQDDYFAAYRSLKLTRDAAGVLVQCNIDMRHAICHSQ